MRADGLHPASFAMVMATGIVSIAAYLRGWPSIAAALFALNIALYVWLWGLTAVRVIRHRSQLVADILHHGRSVGFFTTAAATCVLGSQFLTIGHAWGVAAVLWTAGLLLWALITYGVFTVLTVKRDKPSLAEGINGGWLLPVVAAQAVAVLGVQLAAGFVVAQRVVLFICLCFWLGGGMLYTWIISLIFYRYTFFSMLPSELAPPYWINMGAVAISTLAGALLISAAPASPDLMPLLPFLKGLALFFWSTATWWIPMLVLLGIWRHGIARFPFRYDPLYWGAVFPLGMYSVSTYRLSEAIDAPALMSIARVFAPVALAAWAVVAASALIKGTRPRDS